MTSPSAQKAAGEIPECDHYWIVRLLPNGEPDYRVGIHGIRTPAAHATCQKCNARTYLTAEQLAEMPIRSAP